MHIVCSNSGTIRATIKRKVLTFTARFSTLVGAVRTHKATKEQGLLSLLAQSSARKATFMEEIIYLNHLNHQNSYLFGHEKGRSKCRCGSPCMKLACKGTVGAVFHLNCEQQPEFYLFVVISSYFLNNYLQFN